MHGMHIIFKLQSTLRLPAGLINTDKGGIKAMGNIMSDIKNNTFSRFYLIYGDEGLLRTIYRDSLVKALVNGPASDMNYLYQCEKDVDIKEIIDTAMTFPFMADRRLVVVENSGLFNTAHDFDKELDKVPDTSVIAFVEKEVDKRKKLYKYIAKNGVITECNAPDENYLRKFTALEFAKYGKKVREKDVDFLLSYIDNSLFSVRNEIAKISAYADGRDYIVRDDILAVASENVTTDIFKMVDAIADGKAGETFTYYKEALRLLSDPDEVMAKLNWHINALLVIKAGKRFGRMDKNMAQKAAKVSPYFYKNYERQADQFSYEELNNMAAACLDTIREVRSSMIDKDNALLLLVTRLLHRSFAA